MSMPVQRRRRRHSAKKQRRYLAVFFLLFAVPLFAIHLGLLTLPFFWDEQGQFIPTALDLLRKGAWVARSTVPNVHPPGVEVYLVAWYKLLGFSIPVTRVAMLLLGSFGLLFTFLLAIELTHEAKGAPAFLPPFLLLVSPLFYTQSMMAQLDMPAMVLTLLVLLLFIKQKYGWAVLASVCLVLVKETGIVVPFVAFLVLVRRREFLRAAWFIVPAVALAGWLAVLHRATGYWLGDPGFAHYNVGYALNPVRMALSFVRRIYYLFFAEFRWIGTLILLITFKKCQALRTPGWAVTTAASVFTLLLVSILGGAELERYLLPVLPGVLHRRKRSHDIPDQKSDAPGCCAAAHWLGGKHFLRIRPIRFRTKTITPWSILCACNKSPPVSRNGISVIVRSLLHGRIRRHSSNPIMAS